MNERDEVLPPEQEVQMEIIEQDALKQAQEEHAQRFVTLGSFLTLVEEHNATYFGEVCTKLRTLFPEVRSV